MNRDYRGGGNQDFEGSRFREEERFRPGQGSESWRQRGGRSGGSYGDGYRYQGSDVGTFGNPGGGYGEYNWERGGDFRQGRGREEYNRWGDEMGRGRETRFGQDTERGDYGGGDYGPYGRREWGGEREPAGYGYGRGQGSMGSEGYGGWGAGYSGSGAGGYGASGSLRGAEGGGTGAYSSSHYGQGGTSGYGTQGYHTQPYGSTGQGGSQEWERDRGAMQWNRERGHYGKGPKGYTRSDERLRDEVSDRLTEDPEVDASQLTVSVKDAEVTLEGNVPERYMKRRAEDVAESVMGVKQVHNRLRVEGGERREAAEAGSLGVGTSITSSGGSVSQQGTTGRDSSSTGASTTSAGATTGARR